MIDPTHLPITHAAPLIAARELSPVELVRAHTDRVGDTDARLNSFITLLADDAMAAAQAAECAIMAGDYRGPLHGIPLG